MTPAWAPPLAAAGALLAPVAAAGAEDGLDELLQAETATAVAASSSPAA
ncbi:MAG: hypothetical protein ACRDNW_15655 [Trebonia sp.]